MGRRSALLGLGAALVGALGPAPAHAGGALRLDEALARARLASPLLRAAATDVEAARGRLTQAGLLSANPVLSVEAALHTEPGRDTLDRGVALSQEIEIGGQRGLRMTAAGHDLIRAEHLLRDRRRSVEGEIRRAYAGLVAAEERRALAGETVALARSLADVIRRRARAGDIGALDARLAEIEVARATQALATAERDRARARTRLAIGIGAGPDEVVTAADRDDEGRRPPAPEAALVARALAERSDLAAAREARAFLESEARLAHRRGWVPNPILRAFYRVELADERIAGGEVLMPLPVWNREQGTESALRASAAGAAAEVERLEREIPLHIHLAVVQRATAAEAWARSDTEAVPAARVARDLVDQAYVGGYLSLPDVLAERDRLLQVRAAAIAARLDLSEADADLLEAVGDDGK